MWVMKGISEKAKKKTIELFNELNSQERLEVFSCFCTYCGDNESDCQCWNNE